MKTATGGADDGDIELYVPCQASGFVLPIDPDDHEEHMFSPVIFCEVCGRITRLVPATYLQPDGCPTWQVEPHLFKVEVPRGRREEPGPETGPANGEFDSPPPPPEYPF